MAAKMSRLKISPRSSTSQSKKIVGPVPAPSPKAPGAVTTATRAGQQQVASYLSSNPEFLENYVLSNVDLETLERWTIRKAKQGGTLFKKQTI
jgi:hypothetical protein